MKQCIFVLAAAALVTGCGDFVDPGLGAGAGTSDVTGSVESSSFEVQSGSADQSYEDNSYVITLANTPEYACTSSSGLPGDYLTVVISEIDGPTTVDAEGHVYFNSFRDGISVGEAADGGSVTIDTVDDFAGEIRGSVDATGPNSEVSGNFSVEICSSY